MFAALSINYRKIIMTDFAHKSEDAALIITKQWKLMRDNFRSKSCNRRKNSYPYSSCLLPRSTRNVKALTLFAYLGIKSLQQHQTLSPEIHHLTDKHHFFHEKIVMQQKCTYGCLVTNLILQKCHKVINQKKHSTEDSIGWLGGVVVRTLDLRPSRRWFESRSWHCLVISEKGDRLWQVNYLGM